VNHIVKNLLQNSKTLDFEMLKYFKKMLRKIIDKVHLFWYIKQMKNLLNPIGL